MKRKKFHDSHHCPGHALTTQTKCLQNWSLILLFITLGSSIPIAATAASAVAVVNATALAHSYPSYNQTAPSPLQKALPNAKEVGKNTENAWTRRLYMLPTTGHFGRNEEGMDVVLEAAALVLFTLVGNALLVTTCLARAERNNRKAASGTCETLEQNNQLCNTSHAAAAAGRREASGGGGGGHPCNHRDNSQACNLAARISADDDTGTQQTSQHARTSRAIASAEDVVAQSTCPHARANHGTGTMNPADMVIMKFMYSGNSTGLQQQSSHVQHPHPAPTHISHWQQSQMQMVLSPKSMNETNTNADAATKHAKNNYTPLPAFGQQLQGDLDRQSVLLSSANMNGFFTAVGRKCSNV